MAAYIWVGVGSALGGIARYALTRWTLTFSAVLPWGTILINVLGCFIIGFVGTYTLAEGRHPASENTRLFIMVGICGGFTTFSSFSLQTFELMRSGAWGRGVLNVLFSVVLCFLSVGLGHLLAYHTVARTVITQTKMEAGMDV